MGSGSFRGFCYFSHYKKRISHCVLALAGAVFNLAGHPHLGRFPAVKIHGLRAAQFLKLFGEFGEGHADGEAWLPAIDDHEVKMGWAPADGGAWMALVFGSFTVV